METVVVGYLGIALLVLFIACGIHIGVALASAGALGFLMLVGTRGALGLLRTTPFEVSASYELSVVPLFLLMGLFAYHSGLSARIYKAARLWIGHLPGGLVLATIAASGVFGAACGSTVASAAIFTKIGLPEMLKYGHDRRLSAGAIAASGTLAVLIPPSTILVFYAILTQQSIGKLLIAGILPGVLSAGLYLLMVIVKCKLNPALTPSIKDKTPLRVKVDAIRGLWAFPILVIIVVGGIYSGIFTATEAAAFGAFGAFLIVLLMEKKSRSRVLGETLLETARTTSMIFVIIIGAIIFSRFLAVSRVPTNLVEWIERIPTSPMVILSGFLILYIFLGMFLDAFGMLAITLPVIFPVIERLGFDPIWYGIIMVKVVEVGLITPPLGINVYVVKGAAGELVALGDIFRGIVPFLVMDLITLVILVAFPQIALYLPNRMYGG